MRIEQHNLDTLRELIRNLQQENEDLKALLDAHQIPYVEKKGLDESSEPDDYDEDQAASEMLEMTEETLKNST